MNQVKFFKGCLTQILLSPFLNILFQHIFRKSLEDPSECSPPLICKLQYVEARWENPFLANVLISYSLRPNQMTGFYMKCNTWLEWINYFSRFVESRLNYSKD